MFPIPDCMKADYYKYLNSQEAKDDEAKFKKAMKKAGTKYDKNGCVRLTPALQKAMFGSAI